MVVLKATRMIITVFCNVAPCSQVDVYQTFGLRLKRLLLAGFSLGLPLEPGGYRFLQNVDGLLSEYMAFYPRR
jgi:hypothetical protein